MQLSIVSGLSTIADDYDAILLDQFGVLHDGQEALAGAINCYEKLAARGKKLVVLSNTSRRRVIAEGKLPGLGFNAQMLSGFVTSGEEAYLHISRDWSGKSLVWLAWQEGFNSCANNYLEGLDVRLAPAATADFVLCQGTQCIREDNFEQPINMMKTGEIDERLRNILRTCACRQLPMVCANPDLYVGLPDGSRGHMPGLIAAEYERLGGVVTSFGKPYSPAFDACLKLLDDGIAPSRVLHVGDSLLHDVLGANRAGIASLFVAGGIHAGELGMTLSEPSTEQGLPTSGRRSLCGLQADQLSLVCNQYGARPTYTVPSFVW